MRTRGAILGAAVALVMTVAACSPDPPKPNPAKRELADGEVRLTAMSLFRGDTERLEPHLDLSSAVAVKVDFKDGPQPVFFQLVFRHNGEEVKTQELLATSLESPTEVTFSLREILVPPKDEKVADGEALFKMVVATNGEASSGFFKRPAMKKDNGFAGAFSFRRADKAAVVARGDDFDVWGMYAGKGVNESKGGESITARAERVEWSAVLRICLRKQPVR